MAFLGGPDGPDAPQLGLAVVAAKLDSIHERRLILAYEERASVRAPGRLAFVVIAIAGGWQSKLRCVDCLHIQASRQGQER